jgi:ATP-dependent DNA ligase
VVAFDAKRVSRLQFLQRGDKAQRFAVFDCLYRNGRDLRHEPLAYRRQQLEVALVESRHNAALAAPGAKWSYRLWLEPLLVAQIAFQEGTADQKFRQPVFLGLRDDKEPSEAVLPE